MVSQFATRYCIQQFANGAFPTSTFDSAESALETFKLYSEMGKPLPDIIFLDLGLDEMDGWGFITALKKLLVIDTMPKIYILSAFGRARDRELAQNNPLVLGYIDKPLTKNRLEQIFSED